jgi:hypothetical protein
MTIFLASSKRSERERMVSKDYLECSLSFHAEHPFYQRARPLVYQIMFCRTGKWLWLFLVATSGIMFSPISLKAKVA